MKKVITILILTLTTALAFAQDAPETPVTPVTPETPETTPLVISGSGDLYYKYDFSKTANIPTSFGTDQNSVSLGMLDIALKKTIKKVSFVGEISFGPRG